MLRLALLGLVLLSLACVSGNQAVQVETAAPPDNPTRTARATRAPSTRTVATEAAPPTDEPTPPPSVQTYSIGDVITVKDHTIVLNSVDLAENILKANFTLTNNGSEGEQVSSLLSFEAKDTEGVKLESSIFDCGASFSGEVLPGDKLKGDICWEVTGDAPYRIYYRANVFETGAIVWEIE